MSKERELLNQALECIRSETGPVPPYYVYFLVQKIEECLSVPNDDLSGNPGDLIGRPGAWPIDSQIADRISKKECVSYEVVQLIAREVLSISSPNPMKPIADDEIHEEFGGWATDFMEGVFAGVRYAERHHFGGES